MKSLLVSIVLWLSVFAAAPASALTLPPLGHVYFTGTTEQLWHIRAGIAHIAGFGSASWTFPGAYGVVPGVLAQDPFGLGDVDCMDAMYVPNQGPWDGAEDYLGMSTWVMVGDAQVGVEIPSLEDLVYDAPADLPGACYGYLFYRDCVESVFGPWICVDP